MTWDPSNAGYVKVNGTQMSNGWTNWFKYGTSVTLEAVPSSGYVLQKWRRDVNGGSLEDYSVRLKETVSGSASSAHYARVDKTTSNAFSGYVEISMTFSASGYAYFIWYASIHTPSRTLASDSGTASVSNRALTWSGTLNSEKVTFTVYGVVMPSSAIMSVSLSGTVVRSAENPITVVMSSGYQFEAIFGAP